jgi:ABC-type sugar transport system ATPase subunit
MQDTILELKNITHRFTGVPALKDVNFSLKNGEIHGLVGENGAGKSTLVKVIAGILQPSDGEIYLEGEEITIHPETQSRYGISMVPQHVEFFPYLSIAENMYINNLPRKKGGLVDYKGLYEDARVWFEKFDLDINPSTPMEELGFVQQKVILILKALKEQSKIVILDEPTASLYLEEIDHLFQFIKEFNQRGVTFIYISHHLEEIFQICHRVTVLRDGQMQGVFEIADFDLKKLVHVMVGQDVKELTRKERKISQDIVFKIRELQGEKILKGFNLDLRRGEILGILSNKGGGKDELVRQIFGIDKAQKGNVLFQDEHLEINSPEDCFIHRICLLPDDRHRDGLFLDKPIKENISICALQKILGKLGFITNKKERKSAKKYIDDLSIVTPSSDQEVQFLSGGNQQKVVFSKILNADPQVLVLDSPTVGVDIKSRLEIHEIVKRIAEQGISIILLTSDLDEIVSLSDRILILVRGQVAHEIWADDPRFNRKDLGFLMEGGTLE